MTRPGNGQRVELSEEQAHVAKRLEQRANQHLQRLAEASEARAIHGCGPNDEAMIDWFSRMKSPRQSNCVGVLGRRGSGKTTVLVELLRGLAAPCTTPDHGWHVLPMPMDLSYAPAEFPHGLTVVHWLHERLLESKNGTPSYDRPPDSFACAERSYFRGAKGFNDLVRDLAVSPSHYAQSAASEIAQRLSLHRDVRHWLDDAARSCNTKGFVIAVDDVDLAPGNRHHSLIWSLLDELHQDRLFLILAADLPRLERCLADEVASARPRKRPDDRDIQAARDLAYKVLPQVDRSRLDPWPLAARGEFALSDARSDRAADPTTDARQSIRELADALKLAPVLKRHLNALLPPWPRGLENVHRELRHRIQHGVDSVPDSKSDSKRVLDEDATSRDLLVVLAESSFDFDLARTLRQRPLDDWAPLFQWPETGALPSVVWNILRPRLGVDHGAELQEGKPARPEPVLDEDLPELLPDLATCPVPLSPEHPRWAEALLDMALDRGRLSPERLALRIPWLRARLESCAVELDRTDDSVDHAVQDDPAGMLAALHWVRWRGEPAAKIGRFAVGLWPVLEWMTGERLLWPRALQHELWTPDDLVSAVGDQDLQQQLHSLRPSEREVTLLPNVTRELLRLADALAQQPWTTLREVDVRVGPPCLARLAAMLCYAGFRSRVSSLLSRDEGGVALETVVASLSTSRTSIRRWTSETVNQHFENVLRQGDADLIRLKSIAAENPETPLPELPALAALCTLLESPWFRALRLRSRTPAQSTD